MHVFSPAPETVRPLGRAMFLPEGLWMAFSATGAEFTFHGHRCDVTFLGDDRAGEADTGDNHARVAIFVDGVRTVDTMIDAAEKTCTACELPEARDLVIRVVKLSETAMATCGVKEIVVDSAEGPRPTAAKARRIEVIGDSITCGYGMDDEDPEHHFLTSTEDATLAYAYRTAAALNAEHSLVSISGYGVISGYTATAEEKIAAQTIPQYYSKMGFCYAPWQGRRAEDTPWDHAAFRPDLIIINLGTNDDSYCLDHADRQADYRAHYTAFLRDVRRSNPDAKILCMLGIMGERLCPHMTAAAEEFARETGDRNIVTLHFSEQLAEDGRTADWHPTARTHKKAAEKLTAAVREWMGWQD